MVILHAHQMKQGLIAHCTVQRVIAFQKDQVKTTIARMRMVSGSHLTPQNGLAALVSLIVTKMNLQLIKQYV